MTRIRIVGGKIIETTGGKDISYAKEKIVFNSQKTISFIGVENGVTFGKPIDGPAHPIYENKIFTACIQFYRSKEQSRHLYGNKDVAYKGEFGFDKFDKEVCAEGLIGEYQEFNDVAPFDETIKGIKKYLCSYLSIWPPNVEGNLDNKKSKVTLYVKAEKAITQLAQTGEVEFTTSNPNITINGNSTLSLTIDAEPQPLNIECKGTFENDATIVAKAKGEHQILGKLVIKANAVRYKTIIQPVELTFGLTENFAIPAVPHTSFIQNLVKEFNTKSFNQAYIYGELASQTKKIALNKSEFENLGLLSTKEDGKLYLKKDSEDDDSTVKYNNKIENRYAASLIKGGIEKDKAKDKLQKAVQEILTQFDKQYSFKKDGDTKYTQKQYQNKIATTAWNNPKVQKAYEDYKIAKANFDTFGNDDITLKKDKKLHFFYTSSIHGAKSPDAKVLAYAELSSGVAHIFESALQSSDANTVILHELGHSLGLNHSFDSKKLGNYAKKENGKRYKDDIENEIKFFEGDRESQNKGEIKRLEEKKRNIEKNNKTNANHNEIQTLTILKSKYTMLQNCIIGKGGISIEHFEAFFMRDLNSSSESAIQIEVNSLDVAGDKTNLTVAEIDKQLEEANEKLEKLKLEKKNAEEIKSYSKANGYSKTKENFMDYYQDSNGNKNPDFERKSYYQWQWLQMKEIGKQNNYFEEFIK